MRIPLLALLALPGIVTGVAAQSAVDSARGSRDTTRLLPELEVRVTRAPESQTTLPMSVGILRGATVRRAQLTAGLDESLSRLPGVVVLNRYNYSLDQRVSLRGAGSRANFGLRGVKVLLDGVPQTLPDGQSQLTNLDLALVDRVEVLTGSAGALYGNASGGVVSFSTETRPEPLWARARLVGGSFGTTKWTTAGGGLWGGTSAVAAVSGLDTDGFRQHGKAEAIQAFGKVDLTLSPSSTLGIRASVADAPHAENPGALTAAEYAVRRDSAAGNNILRGADKDVSQQQLSLRWRWFNGAGTEVEAIAFGLHRKLLNPLATPPPPPTSPPAGTYNTIDRNAVGLRLSGILPVGATVRLTLGADAQRMRDDRRNERSNAGAPTGNLLADQRETVNEIGPFVQLHWNPADRVLLLGALRYDRLVFRVEDHLLSDGVDNGGRRVMENASGSLGASVRLAPEATLYANAATSFESPTTTELVNQSNGTVGFNTALGPQRTWSTELGLRGYSGRRFDYSLAAFTGRIKDAIVQARETDGRAFFENAGSVRNFGIEAGVGAGLLPWIAVRGAWTWAHYEFDEYRLRNGSDEIVLDGNSLAGVPRHFFRATATITRGPLVVELDQTTVGKMFADDANEQPVNGWGAGVTSLRVSGKLTSRRLVLEPFAAVNNLWDRRYVGSVNINGAFGRVLEPAPGRNAYVGMEVSWSRQ